MARAPFLTDAQRTALTESSKAILKEVGYLGAGTCEFLIGADGTVSFLEVNTRLQVEHPVSEEVTGIDLVRQQFRIADGEALDFDDPQPTGHSIEYRINGEDAGRGFLPAPGTVTRMVVPHGPGIRWDSGLLEGDTVAGAFDSMIAKLIVTGRTRQEAIERSRRALDELIIEGMPTVAAFHRAVVSDPAFAPADPQESFSVHTRWIETEFDNTIEPWSGAAGEAAESEPRQTVVVEVGGKRLEVSLPGGLSLGGGGNDGGRKKAPKRSGGGRSSAAASGDAVTAPMQGTIVKIAVEDGQEVAEGDLVLVLEAMKMEQPITAHKAGTVTGLTGAPGETVNSGAVICELKD